MSTFVIICLIVGGALALVGFFGIISNKLKK